MGREWSELNPNDFGEFYWDFQRTTPQKTMGSIQPNDVKNFGEGHVGFTIIGETSDYIGEIVDVY